MSLDPHARHISTVSNNILVETEQNTFPLEPMVTER